MKKQVVTILLIMMFFFCLFTIPAAQAVQSSAKIYFKQEELLEDYDQLWNDLKVNYPFLPVLERRGINVENLRRSGRETLISRAMNLNGFVILMQNIFARMGNFAHLSLGDVDFYDFYHSFLPMENDPRIELVFNLQTQTTYEFLRTEQPCASSDHYPEVVSLYLPNVNTAYFHFKSFEHSLLERDKEVIVDYLLSLGNVEHIIIDITGNPGGDAAYWQQNIVLPFGGEYEWSFNIFLKKTPVNECYFFRNTSYDIQPISKFPSREKLPAFVSELGLTHYYTNDSIYPTPALTGKTVETQAKRWVLIDQGTYSSADGFAAFCKSSGWATVVGKTTWGDGMNASGPVLLKLKNTGLLVRFSSATCANSDGTMNAEIGTSPDIICKVRETPLETCLRVIGDMQ